MYCTCSNCVHEVCTCIVHVAMDGGGGMGEGVQWVGVGELVSSKELGMVAYVHSVAIRVCT